jgi:hypothetical protein
MEVMALQIVCRSSEGIIDLIFIQRILFARWIAYTGRPLRTLKISIFHSSGQLHGTEHAMKHF